MWVNSSFNTDLKPSIDRKDNSKGYSFNNIQLVTWGENNRSGVLSRKEKILQFDLTGTLVYSYDSVAEAKRDSGINIHQNLEIVEGGYIWILEKDYTEEELKRRLLNVRKRKKVLQYTIKGVFITTHDNTNIAASTINGTENSLIGCMSRGSNFYKQYLWFYEKGFNIKVFTKALKIRYGDTVYGPDKNNKFVLYRNVEVCSKITGISKQDIIKQCNTDKLFKWYYNVIIKKSNIKA